MNNTRFVNALLERSNMIPPDFDATIAGSGTLPHLFQEGYVRVVSCQRHLVSHEIFCTTVLSSPPPGAHPAGGTIADTTLLQGSK